MSLKRITSKDLQLAYFQAGCGSQGLQAIRDIHEYSKSQGREGIARKTLLDCSCNLPLDSNQALAFAAMTVELAGEESNGMRGRSAPTVGDSRNFKVQVVKDGLPFIKLPVNINGVVKGDSLTATFEQDRIVITFKQVPNEVLTA